VYAVQSHAAECYDSCSPEVPPWYSVQACLPSGAVHVIHRDVIGDVINPETHRRDVTEQFRPHPVPSRYNAGVFSHYVF